MLIIPQFQSTLPRGSDNNLLINSSISTNFNPRSLAGATANAHDAASDPLISIHAPSRERQVSCQQTPEQYLFQSTLPRGSDHQFCKLLIRCRHFNPRSLAGATAARGGVYRLLEFQSTLPRGSDWLNSAPQSQAKNFNPRSLAGATR